MSATGIEAPTPTGAIAAAQRVQELQSMIARAEAGPSGFAAALQAAQAPAQSATQAQPAPTASTAAYAPSTGTLATSTATATTPTATSAAGAQAGTGASQYDPSIDQAAARYGLDPALLHGLIQQESGFDPNAQSSAGALGLTQLMPGTASSLGVSEPLNPAQSIEGGARYLSRLMSQFGGNAEDALAAYNAGPGAVQKYGGVPPYAETQDYVTKVLGYANAYRQTQSAQAAPRAVAPAPAATGSIV